MSSSYNERENAIREIAYYLHLETGNNDADANWYDAEKIYQSTENNTQEYTNTALNYERFKMILRLLTFDPDKPTIDLDYDHLSSQIFKHRYSFRIYELYNVIHEFHLDQSQYPKITHGETIITDKREIVRYIFDKIDIKIDDERIDKILSQSSDDDTLRHIYN